jgi:DNA topoisomerase-1
LAEFKFLGKDSVPWHKEIVLPPIVHEQLDELIRTARPSSSSSNGDGSAGDQPPDAVDREGHPTRDLPQIFPDIGSRHINTFLSRIQKGLSAKVFRTHHATQAVRESLQDAGVRAGAPEYKKWEAVSLANLEAAILCNHTKKYNGDWEAAKARYEERIEKAYARRERYEAQVAERKEKLQLLEVEAAAKRSIAQAAVDKIDPAKEARLEKARERYERTVERYAKRIARAKELLATARGRVVRAERAAGKIKAQMNLASHKRTWNLNTSLKSYIDPRVYVRWGERVKYDVIEKYYSKALRRKFAWAKDEDSG